MKHFVLSLHHQFHRTVAADNRAERGHAMFLGKSVEAFHDRPLRSRRQIRNPQSDYRTPDAK